jgi:hypothetical protein
MLSIQILPIIVLEVFLILRENLTVCDGLCVVNNKASLFTTYKQLTYLLTYLLTYSMEQSPS